MAETATRRKETKKATRTQPQNKDRKVALGGVKSPQSAPRRSCCHISAPNGSSPCRATAISINAAPSGQQVLLPHLCPTRLLSPRLATAVNILTSYPGQRLLAKLTERAWVAVMYQAATTGGTKTISDHGWGHRPWLSQTSKRERPCTEQATRRMEAPQAKRERQPLGRVEPPQSASQGLWLQKAAPHPAGNRSCCHISAPHGLASVPPSSVS